LLGPDDRHLEYPGNPAESNGLRRDRRTVVDRRHQPCLKIDQYEH
jgi:hypothetical protein